MKKKIKKLIKPYLGYMLRNKHVVTGTSRLPLLRSVDKWKKSLEPLPSSSSISFAYSHLLLCTHRCVNQSVHPFPLKVKGTESLS